MGRRTSTTTARRPVRKAAGYISHYRPDHPLASSQGYVTEHRMVFYETRGPGPHSCTWCTRPLRFASDPVVKPDTLCVDHLDDDPTNNAPENLVPSCSPCNAVRARHPHLFADRVTAVRNVDRARAGGRDAA